MKLERLPEYVTITVVTALGVGFAVFAGRYTGSGQLSLILMLLATVAALAVVVTLRKSIWLLIPAAWLLSDRILILPVPFTVRDIFVGLVFASYCAFVALKIVRVKPKFTTLDLLLFANLLYLAITFIRNPVGLDWLGSERVGGRPYFNAFVAFLAYLVLRRVTPSRRELAALPWLITATSFFIGFLNLIAHLFPRTAPILGSVYSGISQSTYFQETALTGEGEKTRLAQLSTFGITAAGLLCALYRPVTLLIPFFIWRFLLFVTVMLAVTFSGHRSVLLAVMLIFTLGSYYWGRIRDAIHVGIAGICVLVMLILAQGRLIDLPFSIQRTLSWLPGEWDYQARSNASHSNEWRIQMWKIALKDSNYISNKLLGDGFGFTKWDLAVINQGVYAQQMGLATTLDSQEAMMIAGNYHSGPITTLKFVGVVGSVLYYALFIGMAVQGHRLILRARGTPNFGAALFVCIPIVYFPFYYIVVFGAFDTALPTTIMSLGLLQALGRGIEMQENDDNASPRQTVSVRPKRPLIASL